MIRCFLLTEIPLIRVWLRRYSTTNTDSDPYLYHDAKYLLGDFPHPLRQPDEYEDWTDRVTALRVPDEDPRWPSVCERCDYKFRPEDEHQMFADRLLRRSDGNGF